MQCFCRNMEPSRNTVTLSYLSRSCWASEYGELRWLLIHTLSTSPWKSQYCFASIGQGGGHAIIKFQMNSTRHFWHAIGLLYTFPIQHLNYILQHLIRLFIIVGVYGFVFIHVAIFLVIKSSSSSPKIVEYRIPLQLGFWSSTSLHHVLWRCSRTQRAWNHWFFSTKLLSNATHHTRFTAFCSHFFFFSRRSKSKKCMWIEKTCLIDSLCSAHDSTHRWNTPWSKRCLLELTPQTSDGALSKWIFAIE